MIHRFSIVTPSCNQAPYIAQTIESVLSQAGDFEIEYFVMDGGSNDGSVDIIRNYADQVSSGRWAGKCAELTMHWTSQPDGGQSDAINQGLRRATGDICSYLNSDDCYLPGAFAHVAREFDTHPKADFVFGDGDVIDETGNLQWEWLSRPYNHRVMTSYHFLWNDFTNYIMQQATFWRSRVRDRIGEFDETFHYAMDVEYWIRAGDAGLTLHHIPIKLGQFRLIQGTKSLASPTVFWQDYMEIFRRYRGAGRMRLMFAFYYYNLALEHDSELAQAFVRGRLVFDRWSQVPGGELPRLEQDSSQGMCLTSLLLSQHLLSEGRLRQAHQSFRAALAECPTTVLHPFALCYLTRRGMGERFFSICEKLWQHIVSLYRRRFIDYRYHQPRCAAAEGHTNE